MLRRFHGHRRWAKFAASTPCATALTIDGLGEGEWNQATIGFDPSMVQIKPPAMKGKRTGELRVMNSANILILFAALRVPDAASHTSLDPLEIDLASLAFSQGHDAAREGRSEPLGPSSIEVSNSWVGGGGHMSSFRMNRREFIGAIGAAAFAAVANTRAAEGASVAPARMQKRAIPSSGEQLPVIGMGTSGTFDVGATEAERAPLVEVLRLLFDGGGSLIDTAPSYGRAETVIGDLLQEGDWRQRAFLATKISAGAGAGARTQWNGSLARLRSDKVDLLQVHNLVDWRENLAFLRELKQAGQVRYIGVTHYLDHAHDELAQIVAAERIDFVQVNYSAATRSAEKRLLPLCKERGVAVLVNRAFEDGRLFDTVDGREVPAWAAEIDCRSWGQLFLKFVLANPAVTAVIPATSKARHMLDNLGAGVGAVADAKYQDRIAELVS